MPAHYDFVDTAWKYFGLGKPAHADKDAFGNLYAAVPSLHLGWSSWCVFALYPQLRRWWSRALLIAYPFTITLAIVVTGNHWILDAVAGVVATGVAYAIGGIMTVERYDEYLAALRAALPRCDGLMATVKPLADLAPELRTDQTTWLSLNRTGLAGAVFELDDRLVATCAHAAAAGYTGVKHMTRIDRDDPITAAALELLGRVLEEARVLGLDVMVEPLAWRAGAVDRATDAVVQAAVIAHDVGAPVLKVPVPAVAPGPDRVDAVRRVVASVGVPVLFLGGPRGDRAALLREIADAVEGGAAGMAIGRSVYQDPRPDEVAALVRELVEGQSLDDVLERAASLR
jgi:DhnA family fructose-bisphosphate aldolase class Ia